MKKASILIALLFGLVVAGIAFADNGPESITLEAKKGNVTFHHHKHQEKFKCGECHHGEGHSDYTDGMKIHECNECHKKGGPVPKKLQKSSNAFHKNCKGCHKSQHGPTKCGQCHKK